MIKFLGMIEELTLPIVLVDQLMDDGVYLDEFIDVVYPAVSLTSFEVGALLVKIMERLNVQQPDKDQSLLIITAYYMQKLVNSDQNAATLFGEFLHAFLIGNDNTSIHNPIIEKMTNCYYIYDDLSDRAEVILNPWPTNWVKRPFQFQYNVKEGIEAIELQKREINDEVIMLAKMWLASFNGNNLS